VTDAVTLPQAGYYTYIEYIEETPGFLGTRTPCGEVSETTLTKATPKVETMVSDTVVRPGAALHDNVKVTGAGSTPVVVELELYGPYSSRAEMDCQGDPYWKGTVQADKGDGEYRSAATQVRRAGFYTYVERIVGTELVTGTESRCGVEAETSLAAPLILTGRGDVEVRAPRASVAQDAGSAPTSVALARLGIRAPVGAADIDLQAGALAVPQNIDRGGWWRDGAAPGARTGTMLLAGHVDSARRGAGAFYPLQRARSGDRIEVRSSDGRTRRWRVTSLRRMRKAALPTSVVTRTGPRRLVLVTCGGPFIEQRGQYRDNIVVTAIPA
jgi:hypothetical protein